MRSKLKQFFCNHNWRRYDTRVVIVVACRKCEKIASLKEAIRILQKEPNLPFEQ